MRNASPQGRLQRPSQPPPFEKKPSRPDADPPPAYVRNLPADDDDATVIAPATAAQAPAPAPHPAACTGPVAAPSTLLQPRLAVLLGVAERWHPVLFVCRLLSVCPAIWFSFPIAVRLLLQLHRLATVRVGDGVLGDTAGIAGGQCKRGGADASGGMGDASVKLLETLLAMLWCGASAYLSFFFTDCLMSRWLLNYTPPATTVRLLAASALNGYATSWVLHLSGSSADPRLLLPAWIGIATALVSLYHITQRRINIRKETSTSVGVFSGASFITTVALLAQLHAGREASRDVPIMRLAREAWRGALEIGRWFDFENATRDL